MIRRRRSRRVTPQVEREGAKILAPQTRSIMKPWQEWLEPGCLCVLKAERVLVRDPSLDADGKRGLKDDDARYWKSQPKEVVHEPGTIAVYVGEYGRKTVRDQFGKVDRIALHLFLLPTGPYIVRPEAFDPYSKEENTTEEV
jgi:hypothetical protein